MKLRIRGNSVRIRVSKPELDRVAAEGSAEDRVQFGPGNELRYRLEVAPAGGVAAEFAGGLLRVLVPKSEVDRWLAPEQVAIEGRQPIGNGTQLRILVEKDYSCLAPRSGEDDSDLFANPGKVGNGGQEAASACATRDDEIDR
jgi:hypothetical protein